MINITDKMIRDAAACARKGGNYRMAGATIGVSHQTVQDWVKGDWPEGDQRDKFKKAYLKAKSNGAKAIHKVMWQIMNNPSTSDRDRLNAAKELTRLIPTLPDEDAEMVMPQNDAVIVEFIESPPR